MNYMVKLWTVCDKTLFAFESWPTNNRVQAEKLFRKFENIDSTPYHLVELVEIAANGEITQLAYFAV